MKSLRENIGISHLFFVDDLILFAKVSEMGSEAVTDVLNKFCKDSGQMISYEKSWICFSPNIPTNLKEKVCENLSIQATSNLGKYLGQFNFVVDRVLTKLAEWKTKFLSFTGRTLLVKSVTIAIPNYVMQGMALPAHLCDKIDRINRDFLWGSTIEKRRMHLVGWSKVVKSKEEKGLGI